jgi:hypothetical protein
LTRAAHNKQSIEGSSGGMRRAQAIAHANFPQQKLAVPAIVLYLIVSGAVTGVASKGKKAGSISTETGKGIAA